jgi:tight adherence protein C
LSSFISYAELTTIAAAAALFLLGAMFLLSDLALAQRQRVARRVDLVVNPQARQAERPPAELPERKPLHGSGLSWREELELERLLHPLGVTSATIWRGFLGLRLVFGLVLAFGLTTLAARYLPSYPLIVRVALPALAGLALGWLLPQTILRSLARRRVQAVERALPDAIELLVVSVQAGLALEEGIERVAFELKRAQPALADELAIVAADLKLLPNRDEALLKFADRIDRPSVRSVMTSFAQTMRYGTPLAQALRAVAAELRNDALLRLEERANRMPVVLTIPMVLFMLPAIFLVVAGPAMLKLVDYLNR